MSEASLTSPMSDYRCPNEHTINRAPEPNGVKTRYWLTCGDATIAEAWFHENSPHMQFFPAWRDNAIHGHERDVLRARLAEGAGDQLLIDGDDLANVAGSGWPEFLRCWRLAADTWREVRGER